ncbi:MAG: 50S ribosomal protein L2 [Alphaproteobacteria bacterium]
MALKQYKAVTPGQRQLVNIDRSELWSGSPLKALSKGKKRKGGRNNNGRITTRHKGGGHKKLYRFIDFKRDKYDVFGTVERIEYDPNRSSFIVLVRYDDNECRYIIAPQRLKIGDKVISSEKTDVKPGNTMILKNIPIGSIVHNIELKVEKGGQIARSAGTYGQIIGRDVGYIIMKISSGETRFVNAECRATIGAVSNSDHKNRSYGKAGRKRWLGIRPTVRGVAMNPIDHPHGGGEGKTSGGRHPVTPWGVPTKGKKTRRNKRTNNMIISRKKKK